MSNLKIFENPDFGKIRSIMVDGNPWFVGKDVAKSLGYENESKAIRDHVFEEDKMMGVQNVTPSIIDKMGRLQYPTWINESGLYSLIFGSKLDSAKAFKRWVTHEVLPILRKEGRYELKPQQPAVLLDGTAASGVARLLQVLTRTMKESNRTPIAISKMVQGVCAQFGIMLDDSFVREPPYQQLELSAFTSDM